MPMTRLPCVHGRLDMVITMTRIARRRKSLNPFFISAAVAILVLAGCGGDEEKSSTSAETPPPAQEPSDTATATTETEQPKAGYDTEPTEESTSPEDQPGGAGDEEPARTLALFTGENGRITPRVVRVPAYIAIRVELRSGDGKQYGLSFDGTTIRVRGGLGSVSTTFEGLRPGAKLVGTPTGAAGTVRIEATAEPGP
jgi:hypothetical protein